MNFGKPPLQSQVFSQKGHMQSHHNLNQNKLWHSQLKARFWWFWYAGLIAFIQAPMEQQPLIISVHKTAG